MEFSSLDRAVYCVLGSPIDAVDMASVVRQIDLAVADRSKLFVSTPNLNFLVQSRSDPEFRETLLASDLCPADGAPVVWIARLIGVPIATRVSGSDIFDALKTKLRQTPLKVFFFGGAPGVAAAAGEALNAVRLGLTFVGAIDPGFVEPDELDQPRYFAQINASRADFLVAALGAKKGQSWLHRNRNFITAPVRAHLGAVINFQAGSVRRAPPRMRAWGLEWLWRIQEEPHLWRRYAHDAEVLFRMMIQRVLPLAILNRWIRVLARHWPRPLHIVAGDHPNTATLELHGDAVQNQVSQAVIRFRATLTATTPRVTIDMTHIRQIDPRFLGLLFVLRKELKEQGRILHLVGASRWVQTIFQLNDASFLFANRE